MSVQRETEEPSKVYSHAIEPVGSNTHLEAIEHCPGRCRRIVLIGNIEERGSLTLG